jgi:hypothetical protein
VFRWSLVPFPKIVPGIVPILLYIAAVSAAERPRRESGQ